ncbi:putative protein kinase RLK-Pelle-LRR-III family [Helianthus annuus]|nr:putative protein kinase RLK-Pelle-LRR-III family [Helianthus annuus]
MSSLFVFVFSVLILHAGATTLLRDSAPRGNPTAITTSGNTISACGGNCNRNPYSVTYCDGNCNRNTYSETSYAVNKPASDPLNLEEKQALLSFINKLLPNASSLNWTESGYACSWKGVTCNPSGITVLYLRLPLKNLTGEIPPNTIGKLTSLRVLSLGHNRLSGEIPSDFSNLNFLTTLYLNHNNFSGNIPSFFSSLSYLTILRLDNNSFSGNLPDMIKAQDLSTFDVSYNKLDGPIPRSLSGFPLSAFSNNSNLCGPPLSLCNASFSPPKSDGEGDDTSTPKRRAIFGIFSGSTMMLLIFLGSVGKNMYQYIRPTSENKQLVTFGDDVFDLEDLLKTTVEVLGGGSVGTSYKQVLVGKNKTVVLKILKDVVVTEEEFKATMDVLGKIKKRYVVPLRAYYNYSNDEKWLVYDYMPAGSLFARLHGVHKSSKSKKGRTPLANLSVNDLVHENPNINVQEKGSALDSHHSPSPVLVAAPMEAEDTPANPIGVSGSPNSFDDDVKAINQGSVPTQFNWDCRVQIALSAAKGLAYLHVVEKIVHGNITSSNILFQQETNNEVSLSDYGLNTLFHGSRSSLYHRVTGYWAPEVLETREFTFESDVYSFGVLLLELLTRKIPNHASLDKEGVHFSDWVGSIVCKEPKVELFDVELTKNHNFNKLVELAKECVSIAPSQRPPMCDVVSRMEDMLSYKLKGYNDRPSSMELVIL